MISRRRFVAQAAALGGALAVGAGPLRALQAGAPATLTVYKSRTCGCCEKWVDHVKAAGFNAVVHNDEDMDTVKDNLGVPRGVRSCHTAQVEKYLLEGHVPAEDIQRLLKEKPRVAGLAVPGMPASSPGMAVEGAPHQPFETVTFQHDGTTALYARH
ncbi:MAG TPA: DUF411 domain-containing protein [Gemmatimonadales bacterium]|nr:DUF411 domain-containing protein [Gemmatimonadales bacterium]